MRETTQLTQSIEQTIRPTFVSDKYAFIKTAPIIELVQAQGFDLTSIKQGRANKPERKGFEKHQLIFTHPTLGADADSVLRCLVRNSHDRTSALEFHLGFFRMACENGLVVGSGLMGSFKVYHTGDIQEKIFQTVSSMLGNVDKVLATRENMRMKVLTYQQELAFMQDAKQVINEVRKIETSSDLVLDVVRRDADNASDLWSTFNRVQETALGQLTGIRVVHDAVTGNTTRKVIRSRKVKSLDIDTKLNTKLFDVAMRYL